MCETCESEEEDGGKRASGRCEMGKQDQEE